MEKSAANIWLRFLGLFLIVFAVLSTGLFFKSRHAYKEIKSYRDSLKNCKELYSDLKEQYSILESKYNLALRSALQGTKLIAENQQQLVKLQKVLQTQDSVLRAVQMTVKEMLAGYDESQLKIEIKDGKLYVTMRNKLLFPSGSDRVQPQGVRALGQLARVLKKNPDLQIMIEGHTDNVPVKKSRCWKDNWDLSAARSISVARILIDKYGINPERIEIAGKAQFDPVAPNLTERGRMLNRRTEIIITPDLSELYKILNQ